MARPRKLDRPRQIEIRLPESLYTRLMAELHSDLEGRVPVGAISSLYEELTATWLKTRGHDV